MEKELAKKKAKLRAGVAALAWPRLHRGKLQSKTAAALDALLPSILDKAFKGEL